MPDLRKIDKLHPEAKAPSLGKGIFQRPITILETGGVIIRFYKRKKSGEVEDLLKKGCTFTGIQTWR